MKAITRAKTLILLVFLGVTLTASTAVRADYLSRSLPQTNVKLANYQKAIQEKYGIDLNNFQQQLSGGEADEQPITKYRLDQILLGIAVELEHTNDKYKALEITTDHLEEIPDYYTRLLKMEKQAFKELGIEDPHHH
ncbi:MAG: DUF5661 family protein [Prochloraceae cyanobacterium]